MSNSIMTNSCNCPIKQSNNSVAGTITQSLGVSGPLLHMADMSSFWVCIYCNNILIGQKLTEIWLNM